MNTWTAFAFKQALATQIVTAVDALNPPYEPAPRVITYLPGGEEPLTDTIVVGHTITDRNETVVLGNNRYDETVTLECWVRVVRSGAGATTADEAETRAAELLSLVDTEIRTNPPNVGDQTLRANVDTREAVLFATLTEDSVPVRVAQIDFNIVYRARTSDQ